jgi:hypothetical protein
MVPGFLKAVFFRSILTHLRDGDKGSTVLGVIAGSLLAANLDGGKLGQGLSTQDGAVEWGKAVAIALFALWGWLGVGKQKKLAEKPAET